MEKGDTKVYHCHGALGGKEVGQDKWEILIQYKKFRIQNVEVVIP